VRIEVPRAAMRGERCIEQSAVTARVRERGEQLRIVSTRARPAEQPDHGIVGVALLHLNHRVEIVRDGKIGIQSSARSMARFASACFSCELAVYLS